MAEKTKQITVGENQINVEDLPKEVRLMVDFIDQLAVKFEELEVEVKEINDEFSFRLSTLNMARSQAQMQLQSMVMDFLQKQATAAPKDEEDVEGDDNAEE